MAFWLQLGASGFRVDAAPFVLEQTRPGVDPAPMDFSILDDWRQDTPVAQAATRSCCARPTSSAEDVPKYCAGRRRRPERPRAHDVLDFVLNPRMWLALARADAEPMIEALTTRCRRCRRWRSGRRSCATTTSSTSAG